MFSEKELWALIDKHKLIDKTKVMQMGIAALLPGFRLMREVIDATENEYRELLAALQNGDGHDMEHSKRRGRPPKASKTILEAMAAALPAPEEAAVGLTKKGTPLNPKYSWANMTPEERSAEMLRRRAVAREKKKRPPKAQPTVRVQGEERYITVADVAKQLGYNGTWGLNSYLKIHRIPYAYRTINNRKTSVLSEKNYVKLMKQRGRQGLGMAALTEGMSVDEINAMHELERATAA